MTTLDILNITEKKQIQLQRAGLNSVEDILDRFPRFYCNGTTPLPFSKLKEGKPCITEGTVVTIHQSRGMFFVILQDSNGDLLKVAFFHMDFVLDHLYEAATLTVLGTPRYDEYSHGLCISNPTLYSIDSDELHRIVPIYKKVAGMSDEYYLNCVDKALQVANIEDFLSGPMILENNLCPLDLAYKNIHKPSCKEDIFSAKKRFVFNELFQLNLMLEFKKKDKKDQTSDCIFKGTSLMTSYYKSLPFDLTSGQKDVIRRLYAEGKQGKQINALLQADVGYGKTEVAKVLALFAVEAGYQVAIMTPTAVLAAQHYRDFCESFASIGVTVAHLSAAQKAKDRKNTLQLIENGTAKIIVGTHSCISDSVHYKNLGLMVIDEEHKFGVAQREKLKEKATSGVHSLSMSATPIPRTLALAMFGDETEILEIKTAPAFKKPVQTYLVNSEKDSFKPLLNELKAGHQAYIVCPAIGDDDEDDNTLCKDGATAKHYEKLLKPYGFKVGVLDGKMKKDELDEVITAFVNNKIQVLVATTVVEVGVNVPNATCIILKNAERYGLAQIHQLRGRVGRGVDQSCCYLESSNEKAKERLNVLVDSTDGFYIAEKDLQFRGMGTITGIQQNGKNKLFDTLLNNLDYNKEVKAIVQHACKDQTVKKYYERYFEDIVAKYNETLEAF